MYKQILYLVPETLDTRGEFSVDPMLKAFFFFFVIWMVKKKFSVQIRFEKAGLHTAPLEMENVMSLMVF